MSHSHHWDARYDDERRLVLHCTDCGDDVIPYSADECAARRAEYREWLDRMDLVEKAKARRTG